MVYIDTETCGLCGPAITLQYAFDDGPINIHEFWTESIGDSLSLIKLIIDNECVVGFNLAFDSFQLCKMYTMLDLLLKKTGNINAYPEDHIELLAQLEPDARFGPCLKPRSCIDLMLVARRTKYQITMNRGDIRIRKVPTVLAQPLAKVLEEQIVFQNILFARRKDKYAPRWTVMNRTKRVGTNDVDDPDFKDVVLKFKPSVALKALAIDALGVQDDSVLRFMDVGVDKQWIPNEIPYAPFALAVKNYPLTKKNSTTKEGKRIHKHRTQKWRWSWPDVIHQHISHWKHYESARLYAKKDIEYTRALYKFFDCPPMGDDDSVLAFMVGAVRWKGYSVDLEGLQKLKEEALEKIQTTPMGPNQVRHFLGEVLTPNERDHLKRGTGKVVLEELARWRNKACPICELLGSDKGDPECSCCNGTNRYSHPVGDRARQVLDARFAKKEIELYDKLLLARRFHASFKVIGTLSTRMSGADGLNAQGIKHDRYVRRNFTFSDDGSILVGGDFDAFEIGLADAAWNDPKLRKDLLSGKKLHALFGMALHPGMSYEQVMATKGTKEDIYDEGKRSVFSQIYGGDANTIKNRLGISIEIAERASREFLARYPTMAAERRKIFDSFCSMRQPGGLGTKVEWHEPKDYIESLFGFRRYFTLENMVCRSLFQLACKPPKEWQKLAARIRVTRRDREQTASGALSSALYGAAFQLQAANMRAAANHVIQSSGAQITKTVQRQVWDVQPAGIGPWVSQPCNVHDEILCVTTTEFKKTIEDVVYKSVETFRPRVPLIKMEWSEMKSWADK